MNVEQEMVKRLTPIKFQSEEVFVIPNHSGITGNLDARNKLDDRYSRAAVVYRGTDFAGANPAKTLTHNRTLSGGVMLFIGGRLMIPTVEYTVSGATFTMVDTIIDDADYVVVRD